MEHQICLLKWFYDALIKCSYINKLLVEVPLISLFLYFHVEFENYCLIHPFRWLTQEIKKVKGCVHLQEINF